MAFSYSFWILISLLHLSLGRYVFYNNEMMEEDPNSNMDMMMKCPENGQFEHPTDCTKFLNCWDDTYVVESCPPGLVFNPKNSTCDFKENVDCEGKVGMVQEMQKDPRCPNDFGTFPDKEDCRNYIICQAGNATVGSCPNNTEYNPYLGVCIHGGNCNPDTPSSVKPETVIESKPSSEMPPDMGMEMQSSSMMTPQEPEMSSSMMPQEMSSTMAPSTETPIVMPSSTMNSVETTTMASNDTSWSEVLYPLIPSWPDGHFKCPVKEGNLPVKGDCTTFVTCSNGIGTLIRCPPTQMYEPSIKKCVDMASNPNRCSNENFQVIYVTVHTIPSLPFSAFK